jgi:hypothetical protein
VVAQAVRDRLVLRRKVEALLALELPGDTRIGVQVAGGLPPLRRPELRTRTAFSASGPHRTLGPSSSRPASRRHALLAGVVAVDQHGYRRGRLREAGGKPQRDRELDV